MPLGSITTARCKNEKEDDKIMWRSVAEGKRQHLLPFYLKLQRRLRWKLLLLRNRPANHFAFEEIYLRHQNQKASMSLCMHIADLEDQLQQVKRVWCSKPVGIHYWKYYTSSSSFFFKGLRSMQQLSALSWSAFCIAPMDVSYKLQPLDCSDLFDQLKLVAYVLRKMKNEKEPKVALCGICSSSTSVHRPPCMESQNLTFTIYYMRKMRMVRVMICTITIKNGK